MGRIELIVHGNSNDSSYMHSVGGHFHIGPIKHVVISGNRSGAMPSPPSCTLKIETEAKFDDSLARKLSAYFKADPSAHFISVSVHASLMQ